MLRHYFLNVIGSDSLCYSAALYRRGRLVAVRRAKSPAEAVSAVRSELRRLRRGGLLVRG